MNEVYKHMKYLFNNESSFLGTIDSLIPHYKYLVKNKRQIFQDPEREYYYWLIRGIQNLRNSMNE